MQVFIVQLLHWLVDNDVVQVELDTPTVLQNLRHDLFERCWCRCQPKTNTLEPKNSFVHYKRCYIPTRKVEASPMVGWCQVQLRKVWHSSHWVEEFINMGQWKGVENDSLIWFTQVDARTNFPIWLLMTTIWETHSGVFVHSMMPWYSILKHFVEILSHNVMGRQRNLDRTG